MKALQNRIMKTKNISPTHVIHINKIKIPDYVNFTGRWLLTDNLEIRVEDENRKYTLVFKEKDS